MGWWMEKNWLSLGKLAVFHMSKLLTFWFFMMGIGLAYGQTSVKRIDSLIEVTKVTSDERAIARLLEVINKESSAINYKKGLASYYIIKGVNLGNSGKYAEALELTYKVEQKIIDSEDNERIAHLYALRASCFMQLSFFEKSREYLLIATQYANKITDSNSKYISLGRIYRIKAANFKKDIQHINLDSTIFYLKKSYLIQKKAAKNEVINGGIVLQGGVLGSFYFDTKNLDSSKYYYREAIVIAEKHNLQKYSVYSLTGMGKINFEENQMDSALFYFNKAMDGATKNNSGLELKEIYKNLAATYDTIDQYQTAKYFYKKYAAITDSILLANKNSSSLAAKYIINEQNIVRQKQDQLRNVYLFFAGLVAILSIFIVFILYKNISVSRRNNKALNQINKEMVQQNEYLQNTLAALEQSNEDNNRVMQIIAHDLRSPMAAIVGLSNFMIKEHNLAEEDLEVLTLIHSSGIDSLSFINEILQRETEAVSLKKETVNLHQLVKYCITQSQFKAKEKGQKISLAAADVYAPIHREKIWRVVSNLLNNAIKFSPEQTTIQVKLQIDNGNALFSVDDNGIGIPDNLKAKIFSNSKESKRLGTAGETSFGVGLSICKDIIEAHGGEIWFDSQEGKGTTFYFSLPIGSKTS